MTKSLFREDAYLQDILGEVTGHTPEGGVILDQTIFYPTGGGQPGGQWPPRLGSTNSQGRWAEDCDHDQGRRRRDHSCARRARQFA